MNNSTFLVHHGVKGQKWGVRRYQNPDGSLTDEGRRRYGYGSEAGKMITKNTKERMKQGTKLGAKIGAAVGGVGGATAAIATMSLMMPYYGLPAAGVMAGANFMTNFATGTLSGGWNGFLAGSVVGAVETHKGRNYIERYDKGLDAFEERDRKAEQKKRQK